MNSGIPDGKFAPYMLIFYTIQSNALCFVFFSILAVKNLIDIKTNGIKGSTSVFPHLKGAVTMTISMTFIIYHFVLVPLYTSHDANYRVLNWQNILVHYFVPIMTVLDWLLFDKKQNFRWFDPMLWITVPISYFVFLIVRAKIGGIIAIVQSKYPYFFVDVDILGWLNVLKYAGVFILGFLVLGYVIYLVDKISLENIRFDFVKPTSYYSNTYKA
ncbi:Pr6Pr family membrane protein [Ruminiclostridium papyrosolvens]|uniref:Pr6Pr family membrane protein n=1 Tax=Ruminiclostridium papyrosolvens TaxID=29362 RepID=UPI001FA7BF68|nr:Pr6Pr family membrane protein [Ruminiclostridium papyrosolvens]